MNTAIKLRFKTKIKQYTMKTAEALVGGLCVQASSDRASSQTMANSAVRPPLSITETLLFVSIHPLRGMRRGEKDREKERERERIKERDGCISAGQG